MTELRQHPSLTPTGLVVGGAPLLVLGVEVHNSGASTPSAIERSFSAVRALGANTVLAPVAWEQFEPTEGQYDSALLTLMVETARRLGLRLIPLWFGSWKNGRSSYVPAWVKLDRERFPRAVLGSGARVEHLSPFASASREADTRAFSALMAAIRALDPHGSVIPMVQVENEVGLLGDSRDHSEIAEAVFTEDVPPSVIDAVIGHPELPVHASWVDAGSQVSGSWAAMFGDSVHGDEAFMAHAYASYIDAVTRAGRLQHDIPCFVNAWLDADDGDAPSSDLSVAGGKVAGLYPSGGPLPRVGPIWSAAAPSIDFRAPDIYYGQFDHLCRIFKAGSGHLFIPEMHVSSRAIAQMFVAVGEHRALGVSPFAADRLSTDEELWAELSDAYRMLRALGESWRIDPARPSRGFLLDPENPTIELTLGSLAISVRYDGEPGGAPAFGVIVEEAPGVVLAVGRGFIAKFSGADGTTLGMLDAVEFEPGGTEPTRYLNGDETTQGQYGRLSSLAQQRSGIPLLGVSGARGVARFRFYPL